MLQKHGCLSLLEIGVGTGRVALPLMRNDFQVTGVDISRKMMEKANAKGVKYLVLADGGRVPFKDGAFDATIMAHVFHILEDPISVLHESARVSSVGVFALVRKGGMRGSFLGRGFFGGTNETENTNSGDEDVSEPMREYREERRRRFRAIAEKYGWSPDRRRLPHARNWEAEQEVLQKYPPDDLKTVSDITVSLEDMISCFGRRMSNRGLGMPEEMRNEILREIKAGAAEFPEHVSHPRHVVYQLAMWYPESLKD